MSSRFKVETIFKAVDRVSGPMTRATTSVNRFSASAERGLKRVNTRLSKTTKQLNGAAKASAGVAVAGAVALNKVVNTGADFEQSMVNAAAKFPGVIRQGTAAYAQLADKAREVGATTEFTATQGAKALEFLAMAGFNADQSISALPKVVDFATASTLDLATASDIASDALGQFNLTSDDTAQQAKNLDRVMNVMTKTSLTANSTVSELFESFRTSGPVATAAGASIETLSSLTGTLANASIKGEKAGTALRAVFSRLQAPAGAAAKVLGRMGIATRDSEGNMLDVIDVLGAMDKALEGFGSAQKAEVLKTVFGEEPIAAVNVLLNAGTKNLKAYRSQLEATAGTTKNLAGVIRDTTRGDINGMTSALEGLTVTFFGFNKNGIRGGLKGFTDWVRSVDKVLQANDGLAEKIGTQGVAAFVALGKSILALIAIMAVLRVVSVATSTAVLLVRTVSVIATAAIWAYGAASTALAATLRAVKIAMVLFNLAMGGSPAFVAAATAVLWAYGAASTALSTVLNVAKFAVFGLNAAMLANPIALVIAAIVALIAIGVALWKNWDKVAEFFTGMWEGLKTAFEAGVAAVTAVLMPFIDLIRSVSDIWDTLRGTVSQPIDAEINTTHNGEEVTAEGVAAGDGVTAGQGVASPQEAITRSINENRSSADITLTNNTSSTAEVQSTTGHVGLNIYNSGDFQ